MSTHYLIDAHTPTLLDSEVNDVRYVEDGTSVTNGNFVVRVPDGVKLESEPENLQDLLDKKYAGLLAYYPGYTNIVYDALLDSADITSLFPTQQTKLGARGIIGKNAGATFATSVVPLGTTVTQLIVDVEFFELRYRNPKTGKLEKVYEEVEAPNQAVNVSVDGGSTFNFAPPGSIVTVPPANQGNQLQVRFEGTTYVGPGGGGGRGFLYLGSWAVIY
jgi:hypothetical protein